MVLRRRRGVEEATGTEEEHLRALEEWWAAQGSPCHPHGLRMAALPPPWAAHGWAWCLHGLRMAALCGLVGCDAYGLGRGGAIGRWAA